LVTPIQQLIAADSGIVIATKDCNGAVERRFWHIGVAFTDREVRAKYRREQFNQFGVLQNLLWRAAEFAKFGSELTVGML
jgi:hypothetical protein